MHPQENLAVSIEDIRKIGSRQRKHVRSRAAKGCLLGGRRYDCGVIYPSNCRLSGVLDGEGFGAFDERSLLQESVPISSGVPGWRLDLFSFSSLLKGYFKDIESARRIARWLKDF
jgi:hypothetical protein